MNSSAELRVIEAALRDVDEAEQVQARKALREMLRTSRLNVSDLDRVATVSRLQRKSLVHLTVADLILMGLIEVNDDSAVAS